jgi:hypothetical protein
VTVKGVFSPSAASNDLFEPKHMSLEVFRGILVDGFIVGLWCYDRTAVFRFTTFDWNKGKGISHLALTLFTLSQCSMKNAGFDPNVYLSENDGALVDAKLTLPQSTNLPPA